MAWRLQLLVLNPGLDTQLSGWPWVLRMGFGCVFNTLLSYWLWCRYSTPIHGSWEWLGVHVLHVPAWSIRSSSGLLGEWHFGSRSWCQCPEDGRLLGIRLKEGDWLCRSEEPRSNLLYELPSSNLVPHTIFSEGQTLKLISYHQVYWMWDGSFI